MHAMLNLAARQHFKGGGQRLRIVASMRFDNTEYNVAALCQQVSSLAQHFECLTDTGRCAEDDFQPSARLAFRRFQQLIGRRARSFNRFHRACLADSLSICRLSKSTLTRGSPRKPKSGFSTCLITMALTAAGCNPRAFATRFTWINADSGLI